MTALCLTTVGSGGYRWWLSEGWPSGTAREGGTGVIVLRQLLGDVLRSTRMRQGRTLRQVSADARVSLGYISEIERGQKEASSELLAAVCAALEVPLSSVLREVSERMLELEVPAASAASDHRAIDQVVVAA